MPGKHVSLVTSPDGVRHRRPWWSGGGAPFRASAKSRLIVRPTMSSPLITARIVTDQRSTAGADEWSSQKGTKHAIKSAIYR